MIERFATGAWVAWAAMRVQSRALRGSPFVILLGTVQPTVLLLITIGSAGNRETDTTAQVLVGVMLTALWGATIWTSGNILRIERWQGTLAALVTGVRPPWLILFGKSLGATAHTVAVILASGTVTMAALRLPLRVAHPFLLVVGILAVVAAGTALGMLLSCLFVLTRHGPEWSSALMYPVFVLGDRTEWLYQALSATHGRDVATAAEREIGSSQAGHRCDHETRAPGSGSRAVAVGTVV